MTEKAQFRLRCKAGSNVNPEFQDTVKGSLDYKSKSHETSHQTGSPRGSWHLYPLSPSPMPAKNALFQRTIGSSLLQWWDFFSRAYPLIECLKTNVAPQHIFKLTFKLFIIFTVANLTSLLFLLNSYFHSTLPMDFHTDINFLAIKYQYITNLNK